MPTPIAIVPYKYHKTQWIQNEATYIFLLCLPFPVNPTWPIILVFCYWHHHPEIYESCWSPAFSHPSLGFFVQPEPLWTSLRAAASNPDYFNNPWLFFLPPAHTPHRVMYLKCKSGSDTSLLGFSPYSQSISSSHQDSLDLVLPLCTPFPSSHWSYDQMLLIPPQTQFQVWPVAF